VKSARTGIIMDAAPGRVPRDPVGATERRSAPRAAESFRLAALIAGIADGDADAFAALYDRTCACLYGVALRLLRDPGLAEETIQEVYLQVWNTAQLYDPAKCSAQAWLTTMTHRRAVEVLRSDPVHNQRVLRSDNGIRAVGYDEFIDEVTGGAQPRAAYAGAASLTERQRQVISLAYYRGLTYREVAAHLGVPLPATKARIRAGLIRLRELVGTP
jgi:RNA polymerase sigma-70 factor, ECF subfamily